MTPDTNPTTANLATEPSTLKLHKPSLIGIVGTPETRRALVRHANGQIETVTVGDALPPGTIVAISETAVMIQTRSGTITLTMPQPKAPRAAA
jgi:hypothetical protein